MYKLMKHQEEGLQVSRRFPRWLYAYDTGVGKGYMSMSIIKDKQKKALVICPLGIIESAWIGDLRKFMPEVKALNLWKALKSSRFRWESLKDYDVVLINFETFKNIRQKLGGFQTVIIDECFARGTMVDTPSGIVAIETIHTGDKIINCTGIDEVTDIFQRVMEEHANIVEIDIAGKTIVSSGDHLYLTPQGWVKARDLTGGDYVVDTEYAMRDMWYALNGNANQGCETKAEDNWTRESSSFLRALLLSEMEDGSAGNTRSSLYERNSQEDWRKTKKVSEFGKPGCPGKTRSDQEAMSNIGSCCLQENIEKTERDGSQAISAGRERQGYSRAGAPFNGTTHERVSGCQVDFGTCDSAERRTKERLPNMLQSGCSGALDPSGNRSGRLQSHGNSAEGKGYKEERKIGRTRVDRVAIYKSTDPRYDGHRNSEGRVVLYDLAIKDHPSFSVAGCVVHNSSKIKQHNTQITKAVTAFCDQVPYVYLLSGTPAPNTPLEYFSQIKVVNPEIFGTSYYRFRATYFRQTGYGGFKWILDPSKEEALMAGIAKCTSTCRKEDVLDLPERTNNIIQVFLSAEELKAYKAMANDMMVEIQNGEITAANAAVRIMKLRQCTSGFLLGDDNFKLDLGSSKETALVDLLEQIGDKQVIIWTQFLHEAQRIQVTLGDQAATINGSVKQEDRDISIASFMRGDLKYLIAHPRSMGHGVTLTNASYAIYYSLSYSHEEHAQSRDRIYRYGQSNKCTYYYLLADKSVDEVIYRALGSKRSVENAVFDFIKNGGRQQDLFDDMMFDYSSEL